MTKSKIRNSPEAKRWLIVGAYQAGATEKHVARISGLSKTAVRNIILNYQRTGTPCIPKKIPNKIRQKLVVEYDENGEIINTDDEDEEEEQPKITNSESSATERLKEKRKEQPFIIMKRRSIMKKKKNVFKKSIMKKPSSNSVVTTKDIINYAMDQMRITDNSHINAGTQKLAQQEEQQQQQQSPCTPLPSTSSSSSWHNLLSPPHHNNTTYNNNQHQHNNYQQASSSSHTNNTNNTNNTTTTTLTRRLPPPSKFDQNIRGYELWTHDDDMLLLNHVLHHLHGGGWNELEVQFNGRHSARLCYDRWKHLKSLLLKGITDKPNTPW